MRLVAIQSAYKAVNWASGFADPSGDPDEQGHPVVNRLIGIPGE